MQWLCQLTYIFFYINLYFLIIINNYSWFLYVFWQILMKNEYFSHRNEIKTPGNVFKCLIRWIRLKETNHVHMVQPLVEILNVDITLLNRSIMRNPFLHGLIESDRSIQILSWAASSNKSLAYHFQLCSMPNVTKVVLKYQVLISHFSPFCSIQTS